MLAKRKFTNDEHAIAPIIWAIVLVGGAFVGLAGYKTLAERPDVTYNITDTGFSLAGLNIDSLWLVVGMAVIVMAILWSNSRQRSNG